jgi:indole-3-glycerol phosphate synthase
MVIILDFTEIMEACRQSYRPFEAEVPVERVPRSLIASIENARRTGRRPVIAEIKPASPTAGPLRKIDDPKALALEYAASGACGVSVLTEPRYFKGSLTSLRLASAAPVPVLRKDFLFDPAQVKESYFYGADSLLLISSFFDEDSLSGMVAECRRYGIEPLVEVHDRDDIERSSCCGAKLYAINNRDRHTMKVDLSRTGALAKHVNGIRVSASGIETIGQLDEMLESCDAALIGSALMRSGDPGSALRKLVYGDG